MTTTLVPDTGTDRDAIARGLVEVDALDHEAALWRELADFLAEPLALHNLLARQPRAVTRATWVPAVPFHHRDAALDTLGARVRASIEPEPRPNAEDCPRCDAEHRNLPYPFICPGHEPEPEPEHVLADVAPRRGGKYRRTDRPGWRQRLRDAWADETGAP